MIMAETKQTPVMRRAGECSRCLRLKRRHPEIVVRDAETYLVRGIGIQRTATCRECADAEWSERWDLAVDAAKEERDEKALTHLETLRARRIQSGRTVLVRNAPPAAVPDRRLAGDK
jgi:hypothetical protein